MKSIETPNARPRFPRGRSLRAVLALGAVASMAAVQVPAYAALFGDNEARRQISVERQRLDDASARINAQSQQLDTISSRIGKIEESIGKNQAVLELFREIENLRADLARMRGQIEVLNNGIETAQKRQQDFYVDLDTRLRRLESASVPPVGAVVPEPGVGSPGSPTGAKPGPVGAQPAAAASSAEMRAYEAAQNLRRIGNYQGAILSFQSFIKQYPKSPLASGAQYWIGDSFFNMKDFRTAITSQRLLLATYPDSAKVPDALLNIASAQLEMGETAAARKTLDEILGKHPGSEAADKAKRRLANLR
jgi:tol-pal system protein YbgF